MAACTIPRKIARSAAALAAAFLLSHATADAEEIGVIVSGNPNRFFQAIYAGIRKAGIDMNAQVLVRTACSRTLADTGGRVQLDVIDYMLERKVSAIVLAPEPIKNMDGQFSIPIPLILVDRDGSHFSGNSIVSTDNFAAGRRAALHFAQSLPRGATVAMLRLAPDIPSTTQREEGFLSVAKEKGWNVAEEHFVGFDPREVEDRIAEVLRGYPKPPDAVFAPNETTTAGALSVLSEWPAPPRPRLAGFDWQPSWRPALEGGILEFTVLQDPQTMGYRSLALAVDAARGPPPPARIAIDVMIASKRNMNDPSVRAIMFDYEGR